MATSTGTVVVDHIDPTLARRASGAAVTLTPTAWRGVEEGTIPAVPIQVPLVAGQGQIVVAATTEDWAYRVDEVVGTVRRAPWILQVPAGQTVHLSTAAPAVEPSPTVTPVRTVAGIDPDPTGDIPLADLSEALGESQGAVPLTRQVIAGSGLTGGGQLDEDITLAVDVGTTPGTVAAGDAPATAAATAVTEHAAASDPHPGYLREATATAAGDLLVASAPGAVIPLPVGSEDQVLTVVGGAPEWAPATGGGGGGALPPAHRLGMVAYTAPAWAISQNAPTFVALISGRIYLSRMLVADDPIADVLLAHGAAGVGPGSVWLGVYEQSGTTLTRAAQTADVASTFTAGDAQYKTAALTAPVAAGAPRPVWHAVLSTLATGPACYITHGGLNGPLTNPISVHVAALLDGQAGLPASIDLTTTAQNTAELIAGLA